jgi:hypothetical protein
LRRVPFRNARVGRWTCERTRTEGAITPPCAARRQRDTCVLLAHLTRFRHVLRRPWRCIPMWSSCQVSSCNWMTGKGTLSAHRRADCLRGDSGKCTLEVEVSVSDAGMASPSFAAPLVDARRRCLRTGVSLGAAAVETGAACRPRGMQMGGRCPCDRRRCSTRTSGLSLLLQGSVAPWLARVRRWTGAEQERGGEGARRCHADAGSPLNRCLVCGVQGGDEEERRVNRY